MLDQWHKEFGAIQVNEQSPFGCHCIHLCVMCVIQIHSSQRFLGQRIQHWWYKPLWEINIEYRQFGLIFSFNFFRYYYLVFQFLLSFCFVLSPSQAYLCGPRHWWEQKKTEKHFSVSWKRIRTQKKKKKMKTKNQRTYEETTEKNIQTQTHS